ncbi:sterile alpha motif domain-containing protein 9-like [Salvelinus alpinus]|uniref:sterile alpha motif domain-containing protein 9-like n=1 Tax=Salvelinus alpinus TaxID=8036 RepID=UPI0039FCA76C
MSDNTVSSEGAESGKNEHVRHWLHSSPTAPQEYNEEVAGSSLLCPGKQGLVAQEERAESPSCLSMKSDHSMGQPIDFHRGHGTRDKREGAESPTSSCVSMRSDRSMDPPINYKREFIPNRREGADSPTSSCVSMRSDQSSSRMMTSDTTQLSIGGVHATMLTEHHGMNRVSDLREFPQRIEDWTKEHVKEWLTSSLKLPEVATKLYEQDVSGASLVCIEKQDLTDLGVKFGPAIQIIKNVEILRNYLESVGRSMRSPESDPFRRQERFRCRAIPEARMGSHEETLDSDSVKSESVAPSLSSSWTSVEELRHSDSDVASPIKLPMGESESIPAYGNMEDNTRQSETSISSFDHSRETAPNLEKRICPPRPFDKNDPSFTYIQNYTLPPESGPSNLIDPVHEYKILPSTEEASEIDILEKFSNEVFRFSAACMNSRTNGTIHFGVTGGSGHMHGQVIGQNLPSFNMYTDKFDLRLKEHFGEETNIARACIRPPKFFQVQRLDGATSDKWVIEVDVVPSYSQTQEKLFYTSIISELNGEEYKTECLFIRQGPKSINIIADNNPRSLQEKMRGLTEEVKYWSSARKSKEESNCQLPNQNHQGQRLKQLITHGRDTLENSLQVIVVTNKCHPSQLEHLGFLKEMKLFAVLEFDPESDMNGTCSFYRADRIANVHYPRMYNTNDSVSTVIGKLNLFKQTSWVFCNGRANEVSEADRPFTTSEWLKKRAGEISDMVSFLCNPDVLSKDRLLVVFMLHSGVTDISSPILEAFCAIYRTLEGEDNMLCICKDSNVFSQWRDMINTRCKVDITSKCIYELSLNEIDCTIRKIKEPQTRSSRRYLPSSGSSSVLLTQKDEELMTVLDILSENECENTEIETKDTFEEFKTNTEEDFYRGGQVTWWNFYLSERPGCLPFIKRDKYEDLHNLITPTEGYTSPCIIINLFHHPGCGGTTLAMHVLWNLRCKFRCAVLKNTTAQNSEIAVQVTHLLTCGKEKQLSYTPVLLLVDNWEDVEDLQRCILSAANEKKKPETLMVIILNCERSQIPAVSSRNSRLDNVFMINKLSTKEQSFFEVKLKELKGHHQKPETFYAFMIMTNNFSEKYIENLVCNTLKDLDTSRKEGQLFSLLALLNTYVNGSYMALSLCEEFVGIRNALWGKETLEDKMNPYSTLLIHFNIEEHGTYQAVRFLHQRIASNCLKVLTGKHKLQLGEITTNLLHCDLLYKSGMGKDILVQNIQSMLITRQRKELGHDKDTLFSPLIEDIQTDEGISQIKEVLVRATKRFDKNATLPQALARHFYLKEKDYISALQWAKDAQQKMYNSYIADTLGQVYKSHLKYEIEHAEELTPEGLDKCLKLAFQATKAFRDSQELAKKDEPMDSLDLPNRKRQRTYNTSGYVGEMEVSMIVLDIIKDIPFFNKSDALQRDKMLQFLKNHLPVSDFHETTNSTNDQFIAVLADHEKFLVSLKPRLKEMFTFFENYFTYLKPRSIEKETAEDRNKRKVSELFKKYIHIFCSSGEERASERASQPKLSIRQEIEEQRNYLEQKRADSFAGLLQYLNEKNGNQIELILKKWQFIVQNSTRKLMADRINFILANIVLHCIKQSSTLLKRYEELVSLLNEALQEEGTHSNCTELYYLSMLLMWPRKDNLLESTTTFKNIGTYVTSSKKSFHRRFSHMFPAKTCIAHFYLGKSRGLRRIIHKGKLDHLLYKEGPKTSHKKASSKDRPPNPHQLWQSGAIWRDPEIQNLLLRVKGKTENGDIYVYYGGNLKISVRPVYLGGVRSGCSTEEVSFYLGFTMEGPVAYDVKYENDR